MRDMFLIAMNEIKVTVRNPFWAFSGLFQPIIYLLLFGPLLNGVAGTRGFAGSANAIQFFAPGLLVMNALFGAGFEGFTLRDKLDSGFLERLRVTPISRVALAMGFILQSSVNLVVQSVLLILCALAFGLQIDTVGAILLLILVVLIGTVMASLSYRLGLAIRDGGEHTRRARSARLRPAGHDPLRHHVAGEFRTAHHPRARRRRSVLLRGRCFPRPHRRTAGRFLGGDCLRGVRRIGGDHACRLHSRHARSGGLILAKAACSRNAIRASRKHATAILTHG